MTQEDSGSGALSAHCQTWHDEIYRQACETSMHTRLQQRDGALVKIYTFDEAFDRHVSFAVETYLDYAPPRRSRRPGHRQHSANLDPRYTPPSQVTTERIIMVIDELMTEESSCSSSCSSAPRSVVSVVVVVGRSSSVVDHGG